MHSKSDSFKLLMNTAFIQMYNRVKQVIFGEVWEMQRSLHLADIHWLSEYITEMLRKMNIDADEAEEGDTLPFLSMAEARKKEELPKDMEFRKGKEMDDPREMFHLIGENLLFIVAQMDRMHNFKQVMDLIRIVRPGESHKNLKLFEMVDMNMPPQQIGTFFYEEYSRMFKKGKRGGDELSIIAEGIEKMKIGDASSKRGHVGMGESSSTKVGRN